MLQVSRPLLGELQCKQGLIAVVCCSEPTLCCKPARPALNRTRCKQGFQAFDASEKGAWEVLPGGGAALRLTLRSPGAESHVLVFRFANVPSDAACAVADSHRGLRAYAGHPSGSRIVF